MAGGISINILSNVREAVRGVDNVADAVEEVSERLHDLTKESDNATDRMEQDFRDLTRSADRESDELRDKFRAAYKDVRKSADDAADSAVRSQSRIGERSAEVRDEVRQNLGEGIANAARGDFESLSDTIGDTLGGAVAGIGGLAAAGLAAAGALGLGAIVGVIQSAQDEANKLKERLTEAYRAAAEEGMAYVDTTTVIANAQDLLFDPERAAELEKVQRTQRETGLEWSEILKANAGDLDALAVVRARVNELDRQAIENGEEANLFLDLQGTKTQQLADYWNQLGVEAVASDKARQESIDRTNELLIDEINNTKGVTEEVDELGNRLYTLPNGKKILVSADTGKATENIDTFKGDVDGVPRIVTTKVRVTVDDAAWRAWEPGPKRGVVYSGPGGQRKWG